jgi:hypothetical protein
MNRFAANLARVAAIALVLVTSSPVVHAGFVTTEQAAAMELQQELMTSVQAKLAADNVQAALLRLGVAPNEVGARVAALSTSELALLDTRLQQLPAGAGVIEVVGVVFVVLLILELVGVTDIFKSF